jgi:hypothetical protein
MIQDAKPTWINDSATLITRPLSRAVSPVASDERVRGQEVAMEASRPAGRARAAHGLS